MKIILRMFLLFAASVLLSLIGFGLIVKTISLSSYQAQIEQRLSKLLNKNVEIRGNLEIYFFPFARLEGGEVYIFDPEDASPRALASINKVLCEVSLFQLLFQELHIHSLVLEDISFSLVANKDAKAFTELLLSFKQLEDKGQKAVASNSSEILSVVEDWQKAGQGTSLVELSTNSSTEQATQKSKTDNKQAKKRILWQLDELFCKNIQLEYVDMELGKRYNLFLEAIHVEKIKNKTIQHITFSGSLREDKSAYLAKFIGDFDSVYFDKQNISFLLNNLSLSLEPLKDVPYLGPLSLGLSTKVDINLAQKKLLLEELTIKAGEDPIKGMGQFFSFEEKNESGHLHTNYDFLITLAFDKIDLSPWKYFFIEPRSPFDANSFPLDKHFINKGDVNTNLHKKRIKGGIDQDQALQKLFKQGKGKIQLKGNELRYQDIAIHTIVAALELDAEKVTLDLQFADREGRAQMHLDAHFISQLVPPSAQWGLDIKLTKINVATLLSLISQKYPLSGLLSVQIQASALGLSPKIIADSVQGSFESLHMDNLDAHFLQQSLPLVLRSFVGKNDLGLKNVVGEGAFRDKNIFIKKIHGQVKGSNSLALSGSGSLSLLQKKVDLSLQLEKKEKDPLLSIRVIGNMSKPKIIVEEQKLFGKLINTLFKKQETKNTD